MTVLILKEASSTRPYAAYRAMQVLLSLSSRYTVNLIDLNEFDDMSKLKFDEKIIIIFDWVANLCNQSLIKFITGLSKNHEIYCTGRLINMYVKYIKKIYPFMKFVENSNKYTDVLIDDPIFLHNKSLYPFAPILSSSGCNGECNFCANRIIDAYNGKMSRWYSLDYDKVIEYIKLTKSKYGYDIFSFIDNNFLGNNTEIVDLIRDLLDLDIHYRAEARVDCVCDSDLDLLKKSGLIRMSIGIESGNDETLIRYGKNISVAETEKAIMLLKQSHIKIDPQFIMFDPDISYAEVAGNLDFIGRNELYNCLGTSTLLNKMFVFDNEDPNMGLKYKYKDKKVDRFENKLKKSNIVDIDSYEVFKKVCDIYNSI